MVGPLLIEKIANGYGITEPDGTRYGYRTLEEALGHLLFAFEMRCPQMHGEEFGEVIIHREEPADRG